MSLFYNAILGLNDLVRNNILAKVNTVTDDPENGGLSDPFGFSITPFANSDLDVKTATNYKISNELTDTTTFGIANVSVGENTLGTNTIGSSNVAIGYQNMANNDSGYANTSVGTYALNTNTEGYANTANGANSLLTNTSGSGNTATGMSSMLYSTDGILNTSNGIASLAVNVTGYANTALGAISMLLNIYGLGNTAIGTASSLLNIGGTANTSTGTASLLLNIGGSANASHGVGAMLINGGNANTASGVASLLYNGGDYNTAVGASALLYNSEGDYNTAIGYNAGNTNDSSVSYTNTTCLGANSSATGDNQVQLGDSLTDVYAYGSIQTRSDQRDKTDIRDTILGLDFINMLRPVDFIWDYRENYIANKNTEITQEGIINEFLNILNRIEGVDNQLIENIMSIFSQNFGDNENKMNINFSNFSDIGNMFKFDENNNKNTSIKNILEALKTGIDTKYNNNVNKFDIDTKGMQIQQISNEIIPNLLNKINSINSDNKMDLLNTKQVYQNQSSVSMMSTVEKDGTMKRSRYHHGLIAQEVQDVITSTGIDFGGFQDHSINNNGQDVMTIGYAELIGPLIKAIQELTIKNDELVKANFDLENRLTRLESLN